jgi:thioredoxin reductase (NADPH)
MFKSEVTRIESDQVWVKNGNGEQAIPAAQVFALTGYHPDFEFLRKQGVRLDRDSLRPEINPETLESNVPGIYLAGVIVGGKRTSDIFIENGRFHGRQIIAGITGKGKLAEKAPVCPPGE